MIPFHSVAVVLILCMDAAGLPNCLQEYLETNGLGDCPPGVSGSKESRVCVLCSLATCFLGVRVDPPRLLFGFVRVKPALNDTAPIDVPRVRRAVTDELRRVLSRIACLRCETHTFERGGRGF